MTARSRRHHPGAAQREDAREPQANLGGTLSRIARRAGIAAAAALTLTLTPDAVSLTRPTPTTTAPPAAAAPQQLAMVADALTARTRPAAATRTAALQRAAAARTATMTTAQRRARINNQRRAAVVAFARAQKGKWYRFGAAGPRNFDCSGLTRSAYRKAGIDLPHASRQQRTRGVRVPVHKTRPGDLVVYNGHVGIVTGRWKMVDAPGSGRQISERRIYAGNGRHFRRIIN